MSGLGKVLIVLALVLAGGAGLVYWKNSVGAHGGAIKKITKEEMEMLVKDLNPMEQRVLAQNPERKKELVKELKEFLAIANQARKEGFADKKEVKAEFDYMKKAILALNYDKHKRGDKPLPPFSMITEQQVKDFWGEEDESKESEENEAAEKPSEGDSEDAQESKDPDSSEQDDSKEPAEESDTDAKKEDGEEKSEADSEKDEEKKETEADSESKDAEDAEKKEKKYDGFLASVLDTIGLGWIVGDADKRRHKYAFKKYLAAQTKLAEESGRLPKGQGLPDEQVKQLKEVFAKLTIYEEEAKSKLGELGEDFRKKVDFQTKFQQNQILVGLYSREVLVKKLEVTEEDVDKYLEENPELGKEGRDKANEILKKIKAGEDFAELAKENSEDPGSKDKGGLYEKIPKGQMLPAFEKAALGLEPGEVAPELIRTKFGYHIIKLEKKGKTEGPDGKEVDVYDARHILISANVKTQDNPMMPEMPLDAYANQELKKDKQNKLFGEIVANNPIDVAEDFEVTPPAIPQQLPGTGPPPRPAPAPNENPDRPAEPSNDGEIKKEE